MDSLQPQQGEFCNHKFRTNLDYLGESIGHYDHKITYLTIIFCEHCGLISHNANVTKENAYQKALQRTQVSPTMVVGGV